MGLWTCVLSVGCHGGEADAPANDARHTAVIRWSSASSGPDLVTVGGPATATPRCFRTIFPATANMAAAPSEVPPAFNGASDFPAEAYAEIEALFTADVETVLRSDSDRLRARPSGEVRLGEFLDLGHVTTQRRTPLDVRLPLDETASAVTRELLGTLLPLVDAHCPHP